MDTTFVHISEDEYLEKMTNRTTYSRSKITWKDPCKFELTFQQSNDPFKKEILKKGDVFKYEIVANEDKTFYLEFDQEGTVYQFRLNKIK